jgi:hypothetical protein
MLAALGLKFSSSVDDVVWLAPFLTSNSSMQARLTNSLIYMGVCLCQTVVAMGIAAGGSKAVAYITGGAKDAWSTEKILTVGAGVLLAIYAVKLSMEYFEELQAEPEAEAAPETVQYDPVAKDEPEAEELESGRACYPLCCAGQSGGNSVAATDGNPREAKVVKEGAEAGAPLTVQEPDGEQPTGEDEQGRQQALLVIAFIGSVDDLTLFVPMLVGKGFDFAQLILGAFLACGMIVFICIFIGMCKPVADCLSKIPLALIVIVFAAVLLTRGFFIEG